jgi:hypothetical protein
MENYEFIYKGWLVGQSVSFFLSPWTKENRISRKNLVEIFARILPRPFPKDFS